MTIITLLGFDDEVVTRTDIESWPLPLTINRPTAEPHPDLGFDEESDLPKLPMNAFGQEPWKITVEEYRYIGGAVYRRVR